MENTSWYGEAANQSRLNRLEARMDRLEKYYFGGPMPEPKPPAKTNIDAVSAYLGRLYEERVRQQSPSEKLTDSNPT